MPSKIPQTKAIYKIWYSPDDGGYYAQFHDRDNGRDILAPNGDPLTTAVQPTRHRANKQAQQVQQALACNPKFNAAVTAATGARR